MWIKMRSVKILSMTNQKPMTLGSHAAQRPT
jgi:hypothetical protein